MLPAALTAKAIQLCAAMLGAPATPAVTVFDIEVRRGATLVAKPENVADAAATVRDLLASGADFTAGPLEIDGRDFGTYGATPSSVFDPCALAWTSDAAGRPAPTEGATVSMVTALLRKNFGARITDTVRPMNAVYGARYSWHKFGQAIDFVPRGGVGAIDRGQVRAVIAAHGVRLLELLGPGDQGHSNHWHVAFARARQVADYALKLEGDEDWILGVPSADRVRRAGQAGATDAATPTSRVLEAAPASWDVFAWAQWHGSRGGET